MSYNIVNDKRLLKEWCYEKNNELNIFPEQVSYGSNKKVWWICPNGHIYLSMINNRSKGVGCPYCANKKVLKGYNDLATCNPDIAKEWNYKKNTLSPSEILPQTNKKFWWTCSKCGKEWETSPNKRVGAKRGCPFCAKQLVNKGVNDFATKYPELLKEWDYNKNMIRPEEITYGSHQNIWWICNKGHSYRTLLNNRRKGSGCPYCSNQKLLRGYNDLVTLYPEYAREFDEDKNKCKASDVLATSPKRYWWLANCGHSWITNVRHRTIEGTGCPICANEMKVSFEELAILYYLKKHFTNIKGSYKPAWMEGFELDIYIPNIKLGIEYDGQQWHKNIERDLLKNKICNKNSIQLIRVREKECKKLNDKSICFKLEENNKVWLEKAIHFIIEYINVNYDENINIDIDINRDEFEITKLKIIAKKKRSLESINTEILKEWNYKKNGNLKPNMFTRSSAKKVWWVCSEGHEWFASISNRVKGRKCPYCANKKVLKGYNDLATCNPNILTTWDYNKNSIKPDEITYGFSKKVWLKCSKGHSYQTYVNNKNTKKDCPYCANRLALKGYNDLGTTNPSILKEWDYEKNKISPTEITKGSNKIVWWICDKGHSYKAMVNSRTGKNRQTGCPYCCNNKVLIGYNDLMTTQPDLIKEWNYAKNIIKPTEVTKGSNKKVWWKCNNCGNEWQSIIQNRTKGFGKCPKCKKLKSE